MEHLEPGTTYTVKMNFNQGGETLGTQEYTYITNLDLSQLSVDTEVTGDQVWVYWEPVKGAETYTVYREYWGQSREVYTTVSDDVEMLEVEVTDQRPCSTATYLVQPVKQGLEEQEVVAANQPADVLLNDTEPYRAEALTVNTEGREDTELVWKHQSCIESYKVIFRAQTKEEQNADEMELEEEIEEEVTPLYDDQYVTLNTKRLDDCSLYSIIVTPRFANGEDWEAQPVVQERIQRKKEEDCVVTTTTTTTTTTPRPALNLARKSKNSSSSLSVCSTLYLMSLAVILQLCVPHS